MLKRLGKEDQDRICSQQVITELKDPVKELIDNSIDAGCTGILLSLTDSGASTIEVVDNGTGIEDLDLVGERGNTSKLENFENINLSLETLGFRGEGLNSIINSCEIVEIDTKFFPRTGNDSNLKEAKTKKLTFQRNKSKNVELDTGERYDFQEKTGTRVKIVGLFVPYVSRRKHFLRNIKQQLKSLIVMLEEYAICYPEIRFFVVNKTLSDIERERFSIKLTDVNTNQQGLQKKSELLITRGGSTQKDVAKYLWGRSVLDDSLEFNLQGEIFIPNVSNTENEDKVGGSWSITGFVSSINKGRPYPDHQLFTVNRRPIDPIKRISRSISSVYSSMSSFTNRKLYPVFVINISLPKLLLDINVTPNKRTIILPSSVENVLIESIQQFLLDSYQKSVPMCSKSDNLSNNVINEIAVIENRKRQFSDTFKDESDKIRNEISSKNNTEAGAKYSEVDHSFTKASDNVHKCAELHKGIQARSNNKIKSNQHAGLGEGKKNQANCIVEKTIDSFNSVGCSNKKDSKIKIKLNFSIPTPCILEYRYSVSNQEKKWEEMSKNKLISAYRERNILPKINFLVNDNIIDSINTNENNCLVKQIDNSRERFNFKKSLFNDLEVIGQFNKGFILTKLTVSESKLLHLFVIDQHASDEKARFEHLNKNIGHLQTQELISPLSIRLTPSQEQIALNYQDIFENNGFRFTFNSNKDIGSRVQLTHLPIIFGTPLKQLDFLDLLSQLGNHKAGISIGSEIQSVSNNAGHATENSCEEKEDSIVVSDEDNSNDTVLWCPLNTIPRPKKIWSILASR